jgi:hypothetical protein
MINLNRKTVDYELDGKTCNISYEYEYDKKIFENLDNVKILFFKQKINSIFKNYCAPGNVYIPIDLEGHGEMIMDIALSKIDLIGTHIYLNQILDGDLPKYEKCIFKIFNYSIQKAEYDLIKEEKENERINNKRKENEIKAKNLLDSSISLS